jgi:NarL family two-component system response regulator LiaR
MEYNILLIDDEASVHEVFNLFLTRKKEHIITLHSALDGKAGIEKYGELAREGYKPDLVLMDLIMPEMDGIETTKRLITEDPSANIFLFTADVKGREEDALEAGAKGIINKLSDWYAMVENIKHILEYPGATVQQVIQER